MHERSIAIVNASAAKIWLSTLLVLLSLVAAACNSELLEKQAEQIKQQEEEIARQRQEIEALRTAQKAEEKKRRDCNRAFRDYFEKAQNAVDPEESIVLYREGLKLCPDDDVAHYELGKVLVHQGRRGEAEKEFAAAVKLNPDFVDAKRELDDLRGRP